ncbi:MAG: cation:proton antiporter [Alphaproteobacteria bacterium]|nr:cation:proton antiporter [Alphaproteobacteria bacterium]
MHSIHSLLVDLTLISIYAALITLLFKKLKQPTVLGYILAGIFAGPYLDFLPTVTDKENLTLWADIGVIFLLFSLGLEFSFKKMMNVGKAAMITANLNILFMLFLGYNTGLLLGWSTTDSFFLGSMISMSSTTIIIKAFDDLNIKKQKFTDLVFGVLVVEDLVGILLLVLLPTIALGSSINGGELVFSTLKLCFFLVLCFVAGIYLVPTFLKRIERFLNDEMLLLMTIGLCFGMVLFATYSGFSSALGAFIMGSILAETAILERIEKNIKPLKDFFGAVFFVSVGMMVNPAMFVEYAFPIFVITLIVIIGKVAFSCFGFIVSGQALKTSVQGGFSLAQVGEFAFIIAALGMSLGVLNERVYPIIVAVSVITTFLTPMMIKFAEPMFHMVSQALPETWLKYIEQNATGVSETKQTERLWNILFKNYLSRLILFIMINFTIIGCTNHFIKPIIHSLFPNLTARIVVTAIALLVMSPFLKALVGWETILPDVLRERLDPILNKVAGSLRLNWRDNQVIKKVEETIQSCDIGGTKNIKNLLLGNNKIALVYYKLWTEKKANRLPLILLTTFRLLVVCFFIMTVVHQFLTENPKVIAILVALSVWAVLKSQWLFRQYNKMETQFLDNLNGHRTPVVKTDK